MSTNRAEYTIREMTVQDMDAVTALRKQSWLDTYVNPEYGIDEAWIEERFASRAALTTKAERETSFLSGKTRGTFNAWVVVNSDLRVIGTGSVFTKEDVQRIGTLYVDKMLHGTGIASELMRKMIDWFDPEKPIELEVVSYNERAKVFYRKWGFEEEIGKKLHKEKLPELRMIRQPEHRKGEQ